MTKPIIGIILDYQEGGDDARVYSTRPWYALRTDYAQAVRESGGIPVHIPYEHNLITEYMATIHGLLIPGGDFDIHPEYYKEKVDPKTELHSNDRTEFELKMLKQTLAQQNMPLLGICAGQQLLNVALGGTLHQDIESSIGSDINHRHDSGRDLDWHDIIVNEKSLLYKIVGRTQYKVNSHHHQAVRGIGRDLMVSAVAPDGVIEAIELKNHPFCIGVEWHPEYMKNDEDRKLLKAFIEAAAKYSSSRI